MIMANIRLISKATITQPKNFILLGIALTIAFLITSPSFIFFKLP